MINKNLDNHVNNHQKTENNKNNNYYRGSSVEEKYNNSYFSKDLEKEYLDIKHLVKNSVEKINGLFNNEEFKQKTTKKIYQHNINKINVNKVNLNKQDTSFDFLKKEDEKISNIFKDNNIDKAVLKNNNSFFGEAEEYKYNSNDLYEELKELGHNIMKTNNDSNNKNISKFFQSKKSNGIETDNKALLNLESNKLYRNKDHNPKTKKLNLTNNTKTDKRQKNGYISNYLKTTRHQDNIRNKDKKNDVMKFVQKSKVNNNNNKIKKIERNNNALKHRNTNSSTLCYDKNLERSNKEDKTLKIKYKNNTFKKDNSFIKKNKHNNSMTVDMDLKLKLNKDNSCVNLNNNIPNDVKNVKYEKEQLLMSINKHLYKGEKREIFLDKLIKEFNSSKNIKDLSDSNKNNAQHNILKSNLTLPTLHKESPSKYINNSNIKNKFEKISTQNFFKMMLMLNQYLISNNLIEDYSNPENKTILDDFAIFLNKNIKSNSNIINNKNEGEISSNYEVKTERIIKKEKENNLINNINIELKNNTNNNKKNRSKSKNRNLNEIFNNVINKYNIIVDEKNK